MFQKTDLKENNDIRIIVLLIIWSVITCNPALGGGQDTSTFQFGEEYLKVIDDGTLEIIKTFKIVIKGKQYSGDTLMGTVTREKFLYKTTNIRNISGFISEDIDTF